MKNVEQKNSNGGTVMGEKTYPVTVEQLQGGIELLRPCMDDYLYLYDLKMIIIIFPPMHWIDSVCRQIVFMM